MEKATAKWIAESTVMMQEGPQDADGIPQERTLDLGEVPQDLEEAWKEEEELQAAEDEQRRLEEESQRPQQEDRPPGPVEWLGHHLVDYKDDRQECE